MAILFSGQTESVMLLSSATNDENGIVNVQLHGHEIELAWYIDTATELDLRILTYHELWTLRRNTQGNQCSGRIRLGSCERK